MLFYDQDDDTTVKADGFSVLNGLKETYNSLGVPVAATVQAIQAMKEVTASLVGADAGKEMGVYFDYICSGLS